MLEHWVVSFFYANVRWCGDYGVHSKTPSDLPPLLLKRDDQNCLLANNALQGFAQTYRSMEGDSSSFFAVELRIGNTDTHLLAFQISDTWRLKKRFSVTRPGWICPVAAAHQH
jgi:hypothetical protein